VQANNNNNNNNISRIMSLSTSPSPRHLSASGSRSPQANISNINKVERLVGKRGQDYLKENLQKSRITTMRTHLLQAKIPVRPPSIGPAIVMLDMLGVPPHEVNQILIKELCEDIKSDLSNMNQDNLILCLTKRIFKTGYYELMDNDEFQAVTLEVINRIQPKNISQELAGLLKNLWDKGNPKNEKNPMPFLREMFMKISLSTRQKIYHWHKVLLQEQVDQHFQTYCIESVNAIRDNAHWDLNYFQSAVKLAESLFVARNADTLDESRKLFRIVSDYLRLKYFETGNVYYGEYRIYLLMNLRKLDFPFKVKPAGENLLKALNGLNDLSNNNTNNRKVLEQSLIKINDELISALNVVKLPIERINRLTDKRTISDLILTYKLQAPRRRKQPGYKSLAGGTLTLNRGLWVYKCREYKDQAKGEQIKNIVQNLKHTYHQERIRNTIGTSLNVLLLTPEIMVRCNRVWFEWCERNKISKGTKLEDNSILHIPTDEIITREMVPRGILQDFDSLMTRIHKEILERYIMMNKSVAKRFTGKDVFENDMIVEFKFDPTKPKNWQWTPIKVRYDKTAAYKKGQRNYGNDYSVANSVWMSINNPITEDMIQSGNKIPDFIDDDAVYYSNEKKTTNTRAFRDFHNKYVKFKLLNHITSGSNKNLLDMTVGKAGDLPKWIQARFNSVVGIDYSVDNIENSLDGACARYLKEKQKKASLPKCMFLSGDSSKNIKNGAAFGDKQKNKNIMNSIYGIGNRDPKDIGEGVAQIFGIGEKGFDIISNQFSTHYFFKNKETLIEFVKNLTQNCKVGGYIVGTCYDGKKIFNLLKDKEFNETIIQKDSKGNIIWRMIKKFEGSVLNSDETSLGLEIDVLQESINKVHTEYLVVFEYFTKILESFGFIPCPEEELERFGLKNPIGSFKELFELMKNDIKENKFPQKNLGKALDMNDAEKFVSFLNNYYIFKKHHNVNIQTVQNSIFGIDNVITNDEIQQHQTIIDQSIQQQREFVIKYRRKVILK